MRARRHGHRAPQSSGEQPTATYEPMGSMPAAPHKPVGSIPAAACNICNEWLARRVARPERSAAGRRKTMASDLGAPVREFSALRSALDQFDRAADRLHLDPGLRAVLRVPKRELT